MRAAWGLERRVRFRAAPSTKGGSMRIGFIGLGTMGAPAALNLIRGGHQLTVHDLIQDRCEPHLAMGARWAGSAKLVTERSEIIFTMVFGPQHVERVVRGPDGLLSGIGPGQTWIDMTTSSPKLFRELASEIEARGAKAIDCPVTGAVDGARNGGLTLFAGGDEEEVNRLRPVISLMGAVHYMGAKGAGAVTKLVSNQLWAIHATAMGEALTLGVKSGVELHRLWPALSVGASDSWCLHHDAPSVFAGHYDPSFTLDFCLKDLGLIVDTCDAVDTAAPVTRLVQKRFIEARDVYGGDKGELHVVKLEEDAAGISLEMPGDWIPHWQK